MHTPPPFPPFKVGVFVFSTGGLNSSTTLYGGVGEGKLYFTLLKSVKLQKGPLGQSFSTTCNLWLPIVQCYFNYNFVISLYACPVICVCRSEVFCLNEHIVFGVLFGAWLVSND